MLMAELPASRHHATLAKIQHQTQVSDDMLNISPAAMAAMPNDEVMPRLYDDYPLVST